MAFSTRSSVKLLSILMLGMLAACRPDPTYYGFEIQRVDLQPVRRKINVSLTQDLRLSKAAKQALKAGVPLIITVDMELRESSSLTLLAEDNLEFEVRYLPLSEHYQLSDLATDESWTYPRLRHITRKLGRMTTPFETGPLVPGDYEFRIRVALDPSSLPTPMQLPALISRGWHHDSEWSQWPLRINA